MTNELRLILLSLSLVVLAGIWWWGARKSRQAPGKSELREPSMPDPPRREPVLEAPVAAHAAAADAAAAVAAAADAAAAGAAPPTVQTGAVEAPVLSRDWGVPPFEPLSIRITDHAQVPILDGPMMVQADAIHAANTTSVSISPAPLKAIAPHRVPTLQPESSDRIAAAPPRVSHASEQQKIISIRVCAPGDSRWSGAALLAALESHGLAYGRYQVFHRKHSDGRSLFCVASLVEPGSFDVAHMASDEYRGVTLFAVLPGPVEPLLTIDELLSAARGLAQDLSGTVQDTKGVALSPQRAAALRDEVARFQASLPGP